MTVSSPTVFESLISRKFEMVKQLGSWSLVVVVVGRNLPYLGFGLVGMEKKMRGQGLAWKLDRERVWG